MFRSPIQILLAEDNPDDANLVKEVLADTRVAHVLNSVSDGAETLAYLRQEAPHASASRPDLLLLDLNMPKVNGLEVLEAMKDEGFTESPVVVVLTVSDDEEEILKAMSLRMNYYIRKPVEERHLTPLLLLIEELWRDKAGRL